MRQRTVATVQRNSYVTLNKHHYSVPVQYVGKRVEMVYDADTIDIFHGFTHVTTHHRNDTPYEYTTKPSHNLPGRKGSYESDLQEPPFPRGRDRQHCCSLPACGHRGQALSGTCIQSVPWHHLTWRKVRAGTPCIRVRRGYGRTPLQHQRHGGHPRVRGGRGLSAGSRD